MSCYINQGPLSKYVRFDKNLSWQGEIMVLNTILDGKHVKLSEDLSRKIDASQYIKKPFCTRIQKDDQTIDVMIWMRDKRNVSKIRVDWVDEERSQNQYCIASSNFTQEIVVITSLD